MSSHSESRLRLVWMTVGLYGDRLDHPVQGRVASHEEHRGPAGLEGQANLTDEIVTDADIGERPGYRPGAAADTGADDQPGKRVKEQQPDQTPPQRTAGRAGVPAPAVVVLI